MNADSIEQDAQDTQDWDGDKLGGDFRIAAFALGRGFQSTRPTRQMVLPAIYRLKRTPTRTVATCSVRLITGTLA